MHPDERFGWSDRGEMLAFIEELSFGTVFVAAASRNFAFHLAELRGTRKLRQHKNPAEVAGAAAGLAACGRDAMAELMRGELRGR